MVLLVCFGASFEPFYEQRSGFKKIQQIVQFKWFMSTSAWCPLERLLKMCLEDLREFLQEEIAGSFYMSDDSVVEQLQVSLSELRKMKLDLPPPGPDAAL